MASSRCTRLGAESQAVPVDPARTHYFWAYKTQESQAHRLEPVHDQEPGQPSVRLSVRPCGSVNRDGLNQVWVAMSPGTPQGKPSCAAAPCLMRGHAKPSAALLTNAPRPRWSTTRSPWRSHSGPGVTVCSFTSISGRTTGNQKVGAGRGTGPQPSWLRSRPLKYLRSEGEF
jgi:hypothetical protein